MTASTGFATRRRSVVCGLGVIVGIVAGCSRPQALAPAREGPGGREQPLALTPKQELAVGLRAYKEVVDEYHDRILPAGRAETVRVRRVAAKVAAAAENEPLQREINLRLRGYRFEWEANVVRDPQVNAFCLPAGKIFVFTGLLPVAADDGQLAAVLSHEIGHALAHHASERIARDQAGGNVFRRLSYDRMQESEADHIGVFLMPFAGCDPDDAVRFWERMVRAGGNGRPGFEFLSDHPGGETRVHDLRGWAPQAKAAKAAHDRGDIARPR